jgi:hypothetical protein
VGYRPCGNRGCCPVDLQPPACRRHPAVARLQGCRQCRPSRSPSCPDLNNGEPRAPPHPPFRPGSRQKSTSGDSSTEYISDSSKPSLSVELADAADSQKSSAGLHNCVPIAQRSSWAAEDPAPRSPVKPQVSATRVGALGDHPLAWMTGHGGCDRLAAAAPERAARGQRRAL